MTTLDHDNSLRRHGVLKKTLDAVAAARSSHYLSNDPLSFCHRFNASADREVAALIASCFAYGNVKVILRSLEAIFTVVGGSPADFVDSFDPERGLNDFKSFKHRFNDGRDLCALLWAIQAMRKQSGSIEQFFLRSYSPESINISDALNGFCREILAFDYFPVFGQATIPDDSRFPFLFPAPQSGSACKRLCMFLRWVVREDDGIDLGLWHTVSPSQLIIPVDTHISRIAAYLGFTCRKQADWNMALEITACLRLLDLRDPVKYDFALAHLGISEHCNGSDLIQCEKCRIASVCRQTRCNHR